MSGAPLASEADRAALAEVLERPEFRDPAADVESLRRLLSDLWDRLLESLGTAEAERYASLGRAVFLSAVAVAALLLWRAARRRRRRAAPTAAAPAGTAATLPGRPAAAPPEAAAAALARGELVAAVRLAYAAAAGVLGRGAAEAEALTGPELSARAGDEGFRALAWLHDRTVFGRHPVSEPEARAAVEAARRLSAEGRR